MLMSMLDPMVDLRALELSHSSLQMMLATPFNNSMVMTGKVAHSRFVRIVSLVQVDLVVLEVEVDLVVHVEASVQVALVPVEGLEVVVEGLAEASEEVVVDLVVDSEEEELQEALTPMHPQPLPIPSPTLPLPVPIVVRLSMSAM